MASVKEMFTSCINEGMKSAKGVADAAQRANAYASLATALAHWNNGSTNATMADTAEVETPTPKAESKAEPASAEGKEALKTAPKAKGKGLAPATAPKEEAPAPQPEPEAKEEELTAEWTDVACEIKATQIEKFNAYKDAYGDTTIIQCLSDLSEGQLKSLDDITPLNIDAFVEYLDALAAQATE